MYIWASRISVVEKQSFDAIPVLKSPASQDAGPLSTFTVLSEDTISILGPRRVPPVPAPAPNTNSSLSVLTSVGFQQLKVTDYVNVATSIQPDITIAIADLVNSPSPGRKRIDKSIERSHAWLGDTLAIYRREKPSVAPNLFAQILPWEKERQQLYLADLEEEYHKDIAGLAMSISSSLECVPQALSHLPRMLFQNFKTPQDILDSIALGFDLVTIPLINESSDAGLAFTFGFQHDDTHDLRQNQPLALDLWSSNYPTDVSPLSPGCECYTCRRHHRAYIHHLLQAKEMLAWTLLQIHNHSIMDLFFHSIRQSIENGTFDRDLIIFKRRYESKMPVKSGKGPRIRGYQVKSIGGSESRKNPKAYGRLDDQIQKLAEAESGIPTPTEDSQALENTGFAQKTISF